MAGHLLDTHVALFATMTPERLSAASQEAILGGDNALSILAYWEVIIKSMNGKLDVGDPRMWWTDALEQLSAVVLPIRLGHIAGVYALPPLHKDPFDRLLIAQALAEGLALVTSDREIARYEAVGLRVIS